MANKNFEIKNGLTVAGTERITSAGLVTGTTTTQAASDNTTKLASTAYVTTALANLVDGAPSTLNTLNEIAAALNDDAALNTTLTTSIAAKLPLAGGTLTGDLLIPSKIRHAGDTDTYISFANNDDFRVVVANSTRAAFNTSKIHFNQEGINQDFHVEGASVDNLLYVDASADKVGIGTSSPDSILHIEGSGVDSLRFGNIGASSNTALRISRDDTTISNNPLGYLEFGGKDNTGNVDTAHAYIGAIADSHSDGSNPTNLTFGTTPSGSSTIAEVMRIDSSGNVGIGLTPTGYLTSGYVARLYGGSQTYISFNNSTHTTQVLGGFVVGNDASAARITQRENQPMIFATNDAESMRIESDGKVGIGNNAPAQMLSVNSSSGSGVCPGRFTAGGNTNTLEVWGNSTASTSTGLLCNAGTNENDYSAKFRNYAGSTIMEVRGDSVIDIFGTTRLQDNNILAFGQSSDVRAYYDGSDSLYITAVNGTANAIKTNANNTYIMQANGTQLITAIANSEVIINNDSSASVDFRVESDNEQYNFFCDASSEIIHFGEGTNSDAQQVIPAGTLAGRRHAYHGGNRTHAGQTFKYCEGTSWADAIKIDWNNASWGGVCMRITGMYDYNASNNFSIVIGFAGHAAYGSVSYDATSSGALNWTNALQLAQPATGETMIRQRAGDNTGDVVYRYEWQTYNRSDQTILIIEQ